MYIMMYIQKTVLLDGQLYSDHKTFYQKHLFYEQKSFTQVGSILRL